MSGGQTILIKAGLEAPPTEYHRVDTLIQSGSLELSPCGRYLAQASNEHTVQRGGQIAMGIPTPPNPLFLGRLAPVFRRFSAVLLRCPASWRRDGENGRKMAENGRNLGEKRARNSGG